MPKPLPLSARLHRGEPIPAAELLTLVSALEYERDEAEEAAASWRQLYEREARRRAEDDAALRSVLSLGGGR